MLTTVQVLRHYVFMETSNGFTLGGFIQCLSHFREESPSHYFLDCFLYTHERQALFGLIEHYIPKFTSFIKSKKLDIIINGFEIKNEDFVPLNTTLTLAVQKFILNTKRFC